MMLNSPETLCVVMPIYNEEAIIAEVVQEWDKTLTALDVTYQIHTYNDGSKDATLAILQELSQDIKELVVHTASNQGHGPTLLSAYNDALDYTWIFQTDSDGEMSPKYFNELWANRDDCDFLLGSRSQRAQALSRKAISFISRAIVRLFYGKGIWDVNSPYRLMRTSIISTFIQNIPSDTFAPNLIISGIVNLKKYRFYETPIPHQERQTGEVSIKKFRLLMAAFRSFAQTIRFRLFADL